MTAEIKGKDKVNPTPAPVRIAPIKRKSRIFLTKPFWLLRSIPEKVRDESGLCISAKANAIVGRQYIAQPVSPQWKRGYALDNHKFPS